MKELELPKIMKMCAQNGCKLRMYTGIEDYGGQSVRDIRIEELLGRSQTCLDTEQIRSFINGKTVLITGGAGSIGSELCRQCMQSGCKQLIIFDICENSLFELDNELVGCFGKGRHETVVGSIQDIGCLDRIVFSIVEKVFLKSGPGDKIMYGNPIVGPKRNIVAEAPAWLYIGIGPENIITAHIIK
jgi:FlaA1/EpsC-like NDP-sugar epimerase